MLMNRVVVSSYELVIIKIKKKIFNPMGTGKKGERLYVQVLFIYNLTEQRAPPGSDIYLSQVLAARALEWRSRVIMLYGVKPRK